MAGIDRGDLKSYWANDATNTVVDIKATSGTIVHAFLVNKNAARVYFQFFNAKAADVTLGTTRPYVVLPVPASGAIAADVLAGLAFSNGISYACTGASEMSTVAPTVACFIQAMYV